MQVGDLRLALAGELGVHHAPVGDRPVVRPLPVPHKADALRRGERPRRRVDGRVLEALQRRRLLARAGALAQAFEGHVDHLARSLVQHHQGPVRANLLRRLDQRTL